MNKLYNNEPLEAVNQAWNMLPNGIKSLLQCDLFIGRDPVAAGLHTYEHTSCDRSYRDTMHVLYPWHFSDYIKLDDRAPTIVIPSKDIEDPLLIEHITHEYAHVLDYRLDFVSYDRDFFPVSWYAKTNRLEAFAEAFTEFIFPGYGEIPISADDWLFFNSLTKLF